MSFVALSRCELPWGILLLRGAYGALPLDWGKPAQEEVMVMSLQAMDPVFIEIFGWSFGVFLLLIPWGLWALVVKKRVLVSPKKGDKVGGRASIGQSADGLGESLQPFGSIVAPGRSASYEKPVDSSRSTSLGHDPNQEDPLQ